MMRYTVVFRNSRRRAIHNISNFVFSSPLPPNPVPIKIMIFNILRYTVFVSQIKLIIRSSEGVNNKLAFN